MALPALIVQAILGNEAANQQQRATEQAQRQAQGYIAQTESMASGAGADQRVALNRAANNALSATGEQYNAAQDYYAQGYDQAAATADFNTRRAQSYSDAAVGAGQDQIAGGLSAGVDTLGNVAQLGQQFTPGATQAIQADPARSRLGELYDNGINFEEDPGYQFRLAQGEEALGRKQSALGGRGGGAAMKELMQFNQNLASQEYQNAYNRQVGLASGADQASQMAAQREQQALLAAQQNQMGLAQMGYGAMGQQANMQYGAGNAMGQMAFAGGQANAQMQYGMGQQLAGYGMQNAAQQAAAAQWYGNQQAGIYGHLGDQQAASYAQQYANQAAALQAQASLAFAGTELAGQGTMQWANAAGVHAEQAHEAGMSFLSMMPMGG